MEKPVAVVGGVGPTLGVALCHELAASNYEVVALARSSSIEGIPARLMQCDLTSEKQVFSCIRDIEENTGHIAAYVHNLGSFAHTPFLESDERQFEHLWKINCLSAYHAAKAVIAEMIDNSGGSLVFVGATASLKGNAEFSAFASSKFALRGMVQSLAREFGPEGIHVAHVIIDGVMWGNRAESWGLKPEQCLKPRAVANSIVHLIEQDSSAWTHELDIRPDIEKF